METLQGLVGMVECGVGHLLCVSVSNVNYFFVECAYFSTGICSDIPPLTNGMISYSGESPDVATYTCDTGYTLNDGDATRTCENGGIWSGSPPVCQCKL